MGPKRRDLLKLDRVIGLNSNSSCSLSVVSGNCLLYFAGTVVIRLDVTSGVQKAFYRATKPISCITVSSDGSVLAAGERGHQPSVLVWDMATSALLVSLAGHSQGISCLAFSPDAKYLVSVGFKFDKQLFLWEWKEKKILSTQKVGNKVKMVKYSPDGSCFISSGENHMKWWYVKQTINFADEVTIEVVGKPASILEAQRNACFMDFCFGGTGSTRDTVFCVTSKGVLCSFSPLRIMEKWVALDSASSYSLTIAAHENDTFLLAGCADGCIRVLSSQLKYIGTLPPPDPISSLDTKLYPACYALGTLFQHTKLAAIYADRQLIIWDLNMIECVKSTRFSSISNHFSCIWEIVFLRQKEGSDAANDPFGPGFLFATCSADQSIRIWSLDGKESVGKTGGNGLRRCIEMERELVRPSSSSSSAVADGEEDIMFDLAQGIPDGELPDRTQSSSAPRCLAVHPDGKQLVCGDRKGRIRAFDLTTLKQTQILQAHASEVLTLSFSPALGLAVDGEWCIEAAAGDSQSSTAASSSRMVLLASAGRDRLIHIFDASKSYQPIVTLDNHSSSVTMVRFTSDGRRLLSCGGDKTLVFSQVNGPQITRFKTVPTPQGTINGLAIDPINKFAVTSGQDKKLNIWNVQSGKHVRAYKSDKINGELYRSDIDPSGMYVACCSFDKFIRIFDFFSGDLVAQVSGHSDMITGVRFSPDGKHLLSVGGDGCVFIWKLGSSLVSAMRDRLVELYSLAQKKNQKSTPAEVPVPPIPPPSSLVPTKPPRVGTAENTDEAAEPKNSGGNPWAAKLQEEGGYELLGNKILGGVGYQSKREKNKFTAQLTQAVDAEEIADRGILIIAEASDDVVQGGLSDDEDDEAQFRGIGAEQEGFDGIEEKDGDLARAESKLDTLEQSMGNLEHWLEDKLREEGILSGNRPENNNILKSSLSSKFFTNLKLGKAEEPALLPPVPPNPSESKRRETSAAVALMQEQLKAMGILDRTSIHLRRRSDESEIKVEDSVLMESSPSSSDTEPEEKEGRDALSPGAERVAGLSTPGGKSHPLAANLRPSGALETQLSQVIEECRLSATEFQRIASDALLKHERLLAARNSLQATILLEDESEGKGRGIAEADDALSSFRTMVLTVLDSASPILREKADFRQSMSMYGSQHSGAMAGSSEALEVSAVLERYSDRLVDLVSEKMVSKRKSLSKEYST